MASVSTLASPDPAPKKLRKYAEPGAPCGRPLYDRSHPLYDEQWKFVLYRYFELPEAEDISDWGVDKLRKEFRSLRWGPVQEIPSPRAETRRVRGMREYVGLRVPLGTLLAYLEGMPPKNPRQPQPIFPPDRAKSRKDLPSGGREVPVS